MNNEIMANAVAKTLNYSSYRSKHSQFQREHVEEICEAISRISSQFDTPEEIVLYNVIKWIKYGYDVKNILNNDIPMLQLEDVPIINKNFDFYSIKVVQEMEESEIMDVIGEKLKYEKPFSRTNKIILTGISNKIKLLAKQENVSNRVILWNILSFIERGYTEYNIVNGKIPDIQLNKYAMVKENFKNNNYAYKA